MTEGHRQLSWVVAAPVAAAALAALSSLEQINTTLVPGVQLLPWGDACPPMPARPQEKLALSCKARHAPSLSNLGVTSTLQPYVIIYFTGTSIAVPFHKISHLSMIPMTY